MVDNPLESAVPSVGVLEQEVTTKVTSNLNNALNAKFQELGYKINDTNNLLNSLIEEIKSLNEQTATGYRYTNSLIGRRRSYLDSRARGKRVRGEVWF